MKGKKGKFRKNKKLDKDSETDSEDFEKAKQPVIGNTKDIIGSPKNKMGIFAKREAIKNFLKRQKIQFKTIISKRQKLKSGSFRHQKTLIKEKEIKTRFPKIKNYKKNISKSFNNKRKRISPNNNSIIENDSSNLLPIKIIRNKKRFSSYLEDDNIFVEDSILENDSPTIKIFRGENESNISLRNIEKSTERRNKYSRVVYERSVSRKINRKRKARAKLVSMSLVDNQNTQDRWKSSDQVISNNQTQFNIDRQVRNASNVDEYKKSKKMSRSLGFKAVQRQIWRLKKIVKNNLDDMEIG